MTWPFQETSISDRARRRSSRTTLAAHHGRWLCPACTSSQLLEKSRSEPLAASHAGIRQSRRDLEPYSIDVEGGNANRAFLCLGVHRNRPVGRLDSHSGQSGGYLPIRIVRNNAGWTARYFACCHVNRRSPLVPPDNRMITAPNGLSQWIAALPKHSLSRWSASWYARAGNGSMCILNWTLAR